MRNNFFWSHTLLVAQQGGYGRLYNWYCTQTQYTKVKYGYLYNWYAATDSRNITTDKAHVPNHSECQNIINIVFNNEFKTIGNGSRDSNGNFSGIVTMGGYQCGEEYNANSSWNIYVDVESSYADNGLGFKRFGYAIRLIVDTPVEMSGNSAIYVGNDGRRYKCVLINGIWYTAENLAETRYRNGDLIPVVTDNTAWAALTTGARCAYNNDKANAFETTSIAPVGYRIPTQADYISLASDLGGSSIAGKELKESGIVHWLSGNTGTNSTGFSGLGSGWRYSDGGFHMLKEYFKFWLNWTSGGVGVMGGLVFDADYLTAGTVSDNHGVSIRCVKDDSTWTSGDTVTDIDGNVYKTVKIGTKVWMAENLKVQHYNDGTPIPNIADNAAWAALTTGAWCAYNNNETNV